MPLAMAGEESTTAFCRTPRQTGGQLVRWPHPRASNPNTNGRFCLSAAREATTTKPLATAGVVVMFTPVGPCQIGSHEPPTGPPQPAASNADTLPVKSGCD